jgi:hypothetical protein
MNAKRQWRPLGVFCLLGAGGICGCMPASYLWSTPTPHGEVAAACQALPRCQRDRVHVFFVNGLDPRCIGHLDMVRNYVVQLGFQNTCLGQLYSGGGFKEKIRHTHRDHPEVRFVLIGYGYGADLVAGMAHDLQTDGIGIDLLVYLAGDTLENTPEYRPENVHRIVNVTGQGCIWNLGGLVYKGVDIDGADNLRLKEASHYDVPLHLKTIALLTCRLGEVAARVVVPPFPIPAEKPLPDLPPPKPAEKAPEDLPPPRKVRPGGKGPESKSDFSAPPSPPRAAPPGTPS